MKNTTAEELIITLRSIFATVGLPQQLVTDNGPPFGSSEFNKFCKLNGILLTHSPPYHPQSNGLAERNVATVKKNLAKQLRENEQKQCRKSLQLLLDNFLLKHRNTPNTVTGLKPTELVFKYVPRTLLTLIHPHAVKDEEKAMMMKRRQPEFTINDKVLAFINLGGRLGHWREGKIVERKSYRTYMVQFDNETRFMHVDHLKMDKSKNQHSENISEDEKNLRYQWLLQSLPTSIEKNEDKTYKEVPVTMETMEKSKIPQGPESDSSDHPSTPKSPKTPNLRRSKRIIKAPQKLDL
nr:uncharacterized protein K02A2.6-like [Onthophagus taurus]